MGNNIDPLLTMTKPTRREATLAALAAAVGLVGPGPAQATTAAADNPSGEALLKLCRSLFAEDKRTRVLAASTFQVNRQLVADYLLSFLHKIRTVADSDRGYERPSHLLLQVVGIWRITEAVPDLAELVTFELDRKTVPGGIKLTPWGYYPAAAALAAIGGNKAGKAVLTKIESSSNDKTLAICTWALTAMFGNSGDVRSHLGDDMVRTMLKKAAEAAKSPSGKARLMKAHDLVEKVHSLPLE